MLSEWIAPCIRLSDRIDAENYGPGGWVREAGGTGRDLGDLGRFVV